jgi:two-component system response regulator
MTPSSAMRILLVENNPDDVEIARHALKQSAVGHEITVARDGQEAMDFLFYEGEHAGATHAPPNLILLDFNLPRISGFEVLQRVRKAHTFATTPVIILATSIRDENIAKSYRLGANTYIQKPANLKQAIEVLGQYWGIFAMLPPAA